MKTALPKHLFISDCDGSLSDTRKPDWTSNPIRKDYRRSFAEIKTVAQLKATLRNGQYTFPGCYPLYFITADGCAISFDALKDKDILRGAYSDIQSRYSGRIVGCDVNYEDALLFCEITGNKIECAYCEE
jgi:hypothetical protein